MSKAHGCAGARRSVGAMRGDHCALNGTLSSFDCAREQLTAVAHPLYDPIMPFRAGRWLVVLTVVFATGSHWFFLQSIAWVGMTVEFSRTEALGAALQKTFDGQHPCTLCKLVDEGRKADRTTDMQKAQTKLDLFCQDGAGVISDPLPFSRPVPVLLSGISRCDLPALPPPRLA
jgi:hypothetical protein